MTVIVAGFARKAGKSTAVCDIIAAAPEARWTAVKLTSHEHGANLRRPVVAEEREPNDTDTGRYLRAGAARALWVRSRVEDIENAITPLLSGNVIIESNAAVGIISADLVLFIGAAYAADSKPSATRAAALANVTVHGPITDDILLRIRQGISAPIR